jgi:uncharacterized protein (TIGR03435 family)
MRVIEVACCAALGVAAVAQPAFEVASVKPQHFAGQGSVGVFVTGNRLHAQHSALLDLVEFAYDMRDFQVTGGPAWVRSNLYDNERYEVDARASGETPPPTAQFRLMLQSLLADRFQLKIRREKKVFPAFNLAAAKDGPRLTVSAADGKFSAHTESIGPHGIKITATHVPMTWLLGQMNQYSGRPVLDKTRLTGFYDFTIEWVQDNTRGDPAQPSDSTGRTIFTAVEETLGLKLAPAIAPFDTLVIEAAEKPSAN